ncbi:MAG TPA: hypothetical protein VF049_02945 [Nocardioidaceae bacterium]
MGIGTGVGLLAAGAILFWAVDVDLPYIDDPALGVILMVIGILAIGLSLALSSHYFRATAGSDVGAGVALVATGAILFWAVDIDLPYVIDDALGVILMIGGVITVAATMYMNLQRSRHRGVVEHRY